MKPSIGNERVEDLYMYKMNMILTLILMSHSIYSDELSNLNYSKAPWAQDNSYSQYIQRTQGCRDESFSGIFNSGPLLNLADFLKDDSCSSVNTFEKSKDISESDKQFIYAEWVSYYLRENANNEVDKLTSTKSDSFKELMKAVGELPSDESSNVGHCEDIKNSNGKCIDSENWDKVVQQNVIERMLKNSKEATEKGAHKSSNLMLLEAGEFKFNPSQVLGLDIFCRSGEACDLESKRKMSKIPLRSDEIPKRDSLIEYIAKATKDFLSNGQPSKKLQKDALRNIVKKSIYNYALLGEDKILGYNVPMLESNLDRIMKDVDFTMSDFSYPPSKGPVQLEKKINKIKVQLANRYVDEDCGENNFSYAQVCEKLQKSLTMDNVIALFKKKTSRISKKNPGGSIFSEMAKYYEGQNKDATKKEKLLKMGEDSDRLYEKYLSFLMEKRTCGEKNKKTSLFDGASGPTKDDLDKKDKLIDEMRETAVKEVEKDIEKHPELKQVYETYRAKWNIANPKTETVSNADSNNALAKISTNTSLSKNIESEVLPVKENAARSNDSSPKAESGNINNSLHKSFNSGVNDIMSNTTVMAEAKNKIINTDKLDQEKELQETLAKLEAKEKKLAKKMASTKSSNDVSGNEIGSVKERVKETNSESDELLKLRKQIEDFKKTQTQSDSSKALASENSSAASLKNANNLSQKRESEREHSSIAMNGMNPDIGVARNGDNLYKAPVSGTNNNSEISQAATTTASLARAVGPSNVANAVSKNGNDRSSFGIILSKNGETMIDPSSIIDNPKEGDIINLLEKGHGEPFLIKENGTLVKIAPLLDELGKPKISKDGKPLFKKVRLSKEQQTAIAKEANIIKSSKEVGPSPVRLFNLKSLIDETVQRN